MTPSKKKNKKTLNNFFFFKLIRIVQMVQLHSDLMFMFMDDRKSFCVLNHPKHDNAQEREKEIYMEKVK